MLDSADFVEIRDNEKTFKLDISHVYPYYKENNKEINLLSYLFLYNPTEYTYCFKNNNNFDLRRANVVVYPKIYESVMTTYNVVDYIPGHHSTLGQQAYKMKNPIWKIVENGKEYLLMYCEKDTLCKLCPESYSHILSFESQINDNKKLTWYKAQNGYIQSHSSKSVNEQTCFYIHQIIMKCYGNGKGTTIVSVDHIDRNPLNNSLDNLRIATQLEQRNNTKGILPGTLRERSSKKDLPEGLTYEMMRKYVYYNDEIYAQNRKREFFRVEHPKLVGKSWSTTKSNKVSIFEKLAQANKVVDDLDNDIYPVKELPLLPKYFSLVTSRDKPHLVYERRIAEKRMGLKMVLPEEYDIDEQIEILRARVNAKYESVTTT
jgi:hypothetical protein